MGQPERQVYKNVHLLDPSSGFSGKGALLIEDGLIVQMGPDVLSQIDENAENIRVIDGQGFYLAPGLVDMRTQLREPGYEHQETIRTGAASAAKGGVTTLVCLPNTDPVLDDVAGVEFIAHRSREIGLSRIYAYASITKNLLGQDMTDLGLLHQAGALGFCDGERTIEDVGLMKKVLSYSRFFSGLIIQNPYVPGLSQGTMNLGEMSTRLGLVGIPVEAELIQIERDLRLAEMTGGRIHFAHISCQASVQAIRMAKKRGVRVTCDTAPFYFALNEYALGDYRTFFKLNPPLRNEDDRQAIIEGLKDGTIDAVASDHCPQDVESKRLPFDQAAFGGVGLETLFAVTLELYHQGHMDLLSLMKVLSYGPARLLGLPFGALKKGAAADFILFDANQPYQIHPSEFLSKSKNSPFDQRLTQGRILKTVVQGKEIYQYE